MASRPDRSSTGRIILLLAGLAGCGASRPWAATPRPVSGLPSAFVVDPTMPAPVEGCAARLTDPQGGTRLLLVRSIGASPATGRPTGDYALDPPGRYGIRPAEVVRVDCPSGRPFGVVPR